MATAQVAPPGQGFAPNPSDLAFILRSIKIAERHAKGPDGLFDSAAMDEPTHANPQCARMLGPDPDQVPNQTNQGVELPLGLRTVDGTCNNLIAGQQYFGAADELFPRKTPRNFRQADDSNIPGIGPVGPPGRTSYTQKSGVVVDHQPRVISNLIVDQTRSNPAAVAAAGLPADPPPPAGTLFIPNVATDVGLSAPFNSWFTLFGQFFDHGLDLLTKGGGTVLVPLRDDDPLVVGPDGVFGTADDLPPQLRFMPLTRAQNQPGPDNILGTADDVQEHTNTTTPFVDQNQTYTSHPSHQVFLREYELNAAGDPVANGKMLDGVGGNIGTWAEVKAQAADVLGIQLLDRDVLNVPLLKTDPYGRFVRGANGFPLLALPGGATLEGDPAANGGAGVLVPADALRTGHAFLDDIAHHAVPVGDPDGPGPEPRGPLAPDANTGTTDDLDPATYDDEMLNAHFVTGDGRGNENIGLTAVHTVFHSEHNRLVADVKDILTNHPNRSVASPAEWLIANPDGIVGTADDVWNGERLFHAARFITEMEYQHLVFEEFARKVQPMVNAFGEGGVGYKTRINPAIVAEFAHAVYRFGHSMLTETVARTNPTTGARNDIGLIDAFLNPPAFNNSGNQTAAFAAGSIAQGMTRQVGNEIDEFVTEALRNNLLGLPLDLPTINMTRARDTGISTLNGARRAFFAESGDTQVRPYESWTDFGFSLKHPESLVNFVAAYGRHESIAGPDRIVGNADDTATTLAAKRAAAELLVAADPTDPETPLDAGDFMSSTGPWANNANGTTVTGLDDVDYWVGGLAEKQMVFGGLLGPSFNYIFEKQMEDLQDADRFYYLSRTAGLNLLTQLEGNSFAELVMRNTDANGLPADAFSRPGLFFNIDPATGAVLDDPETLVDERTLVSRLADGTLRYTGPEHVVWNGTANVDKVFSSEGDDTFRGNAGDDVVEGGDGNDNLIGGQGDDTLTDLNGDEVIKGGDGDDAVNSGRGFGLDLVQGGLGKDFLVGGNDVTETFAGPGDDFVFAGDDLDTVFGDDGDDWIEAGGGPFNLLQGDNGAPFQDDPNVPGHDVLDGDGGEQDFDAEGGDDIMLMGPGIQRAEGMLGFDWATHKGDPEVADSDMNFSGLLPPSLDNNRDRFDLVEGLSGWNMDDVLRGGDRTAADIAPDHTLNAAGIARIAGLQAVVGAGVTSFSAGNIILGGLGSDIIEGRSGDDIIDGDKWLNVQLRAPDVVNGGTKLVDTMTVLRADVFAGRIDPETIEIVRTIETPTPGANDIDTAVFSDVRANYTVTVVSPTTVRVAHTGGAGTDGTDTLHNMERVTFADQTVELVPLLTNTPATGTVNISDATPTENQALTAAQAFSDADGITAGSVEFSWQAEVDPDVWVAVATGATFTPDDAVVGQRLRVVATFIDGDGVRETVTSDPTAAVTNVNDVPTGLPDMSFASPQQGVPVSALTDAIADGDGLANATFTYQWQQTDQTNLITGANLATATWANIAGATTISFTPQRAQVGRGLRVIARFTDDHGTAETRTSLGAVVVGVPNPPTIGTASAGVRSATVRWTAPANRGGLPLLTYEIQVRTGTTVVRDFSTDSTATSFVVTELNPGTQYNFRVRARNAVGASTLSAASNNVTPTGGGTGVPGAPTIGTPSGGVTTNTTVEATARWTAPTNTGGSAIIRYEVRVFQGTTTTIVGGLRTAAATATSLTITTGLTSGQSYTFRVRAVNGSGAGAFSARSTPAVVAR